MLVRLVEQVGSEAARCELMQLTDKSLSSPPLFYIVELVAGRLRFFAGFIGFFLRLCKFSFDVVEPRRIMSLQDAGKQNGKRTVL